MLQNTATAMAQMVSLCFPIWEDQPSRFAWYNTTTCWLLLAGLQVQLCGQGLLMLQVRLICILPCQPFHSRQVWMAGGAFSQLKWRGWSPHSWCWRDEVLWMWWTWTLCKGMPPSHWTRGFGHWWSYQEPSSFKPKSQAFCSWCSQVGIKSCL